MFENGDRDAAGRAQPGALAQERLDMLARLILNRRRRLTLAMIRRLEAGTGIPATVLIQTYELTPAARAATPS